MKKDKNRQCGY